MNCCNEYGDCRQGRDCPVRIERVRQAKERLDRDVSPSRVYLRHLSKWLLIVALVLMIASTLLPGVGHA